MKLNEVIAKYGNQEVDESKIKEVLGVKESKIWKPKEDETVWIVAGNGQILRIISFSMDNYHSYYIFGNCFKTREEAKFARDKQIFLTKFERYLRENENEPVDWKNSNQDKYALLFDSANGLVQIDVRYRYNTQGTINTTNRDALAEFIKDNESDIKKYMFGVE